jgi:hypothetical protein
MITDELKMQCLLLHKLKFKRIFNH